MRLAALFLSDNNLTHWHRKVKWGFYIPVISKCNTGRFERLDRITCTIDDIVIQKNSGDRTEKQLIVQRSMTVDKKYIGVDVGGTSVKLGIVDGQGNVLEQREVTYSEEKDRRSMMDVITDSIHSLADDNGGIGKFSGIGVSAAGCINSVTGSVAGNGGTVKGWSNTQVCRILTDEFGLPAALANDANCAILGELWTGAAQGYTDVLGITLGTGVGGGVITGGKLLEGAHGFAGELGHFTTHAGGEHCICGQDGCYERYASTSALIRTAEETDPEFSSGRIIFRAVEEGDQRAAAVLDKWISEIAYGIAGFVHVFDPQIILIGGGVSAQQKLLIQPLKEKVLSMIMPDFAADLQFRSAALGNNAGLVGAVYYLLSKELFSDNM